MSEKRPAVHFLTVMTLVATVALLAALAGAQEMNENNLEPQLSIDLLFDSEAHGSIVEDLAWRPGAEEVLGRYNDGSGTAWWLFRADGDHEVLARPADFGVETAAEVEAAQWSPDGQSLLLTVDGRFSLFDVAKKKMRRLTEEKGQDPRFSPDGQRLAFVRDNELYLLDLDKKKPQARRLTHDGEPEVVFNGLPDWVYWEEIWGRRSIGFWWSGDGRRIAYYHIDDREVPVYTLLDTRPLYPALERQRYPKAGETLPKVEIRVLDLESGETVKLDTGKDPQAYLARVHWHPDPRKLAVERLNRDQTKLDLLLCDAESGKCQTLASQEHSTWVNLNDEFRFLKDGRFLWSSEKSGWRQLYLYSAEGEELRQLTPEAWTLTSLIALNEDENWFAFQVHATGPLGAARRQLFESKIEPEGIGSQARRLSREQGWHEAVMAENGYFVQTWSTASSPPLQRIRHRELGQTIDLPTRPPSYDFRRLPQWEHFNMNFADESSLPAQIMRPLGFDPEKRYPVLMYHYGCPNSQVVDDRWVTGRLRFLWHRMMAERGYVILVVDNAGSDFFGTEGEDKFPRRFGEIELDAQLAAVEYLKENVSWADPERIGLWGWSGGGSSTLYHLLRAPGVWKAGVSGAPVTNWRYYDAIWIERYLDHPRDNAEGYDASSPITYASALEDSLLLIHGTADNNVHPQNTINMIQALIEAGKQFEIGLYPNARHSLQTFEDAGQRHVFERMTIFFDRELKGE